mmetsp:Transcript_12716/g.17355  ORF Transcript_12716/g.17355 Transcript_12716/m.17355 type:complete len:116 (+) Transcript_12716:3549-3896(+)
MPLLPSGSVLSLRAGNVHVERVHSYLGLIAVIRTDGQLLLDKKTNIFSFMSACAAWVYDHHPATPVAPNDTESASITSQLRVILQTIKDHNESLWNKVLNKFDQAAFLVNSFALT